MLRVALADDSVLLREGLVGILARFGHEVVAAVGGAPALADAVVADRPDVVVTDVRMPPTYTDEGLHAALALRRNHPGLPILVLSQYIATTYASELLESSGSGGVGYLLKDRVADVTEFVDAVERVAGGGCVIDPQVVSKLLALRRDPLTRLTPREREVLALMAEGRSNAAISRMLTVTDAAVGKHIAAIFAKLNLPVSSEDDHRRVRAVLAYLQG
ncbi:two-component system response regulator [Micromonospora sp. ATCC 39149]|uniref:Response regulator transcription factor n=1 Tax=Micromonospora carbonacea TaxID=47853 RepID=A0A7D5Y6L6_9ACTN|nr:response regulator transcription factor [Micromonospora sp. ATCC 39149]EEP70408.1 two-component system response regulator [Micromonospora sp. ATCC 39149]QLJ96819.1 response regulator transcription factor [Micromonospora carbonacea]